MQVSLKEVEAMVDAIAPTDQVRLLQYILPRLAEAVQAREAEGIDPDAAWRAFRRVGERLAAVTDGDSIAQTLSDMRR